MRGIKDFNFPAFFAAAAELRALGHDVFNPAERDVIKYGDGVGKSETGNVDDVKDTGFDLRDALGSDLEWICGCAEAIYLLPGWENSKGAKAELAVANALGLKVIDSFGEWKPEYPYHAYSQSEDKDGNPPLFLQR